MSSGDSPQADDVARVAGSPEWLPHRLTQGGAAVEFVCLPREAQRSLPFLDARYVEAGLARVQLPIAELPQAGTVPAGDCHFIFHSAFCCSTLLGRALDREDVATVLQEPQILADLAALASAGDHSRDRQAGLDRVLALLQRPHRAGEATILKLSNAANGLIEPLLALRPRARAVIMYAPLPLFLLKVASGGVTRRRWARSIATRFDRDRVAASAPAPDLPLLTDLEAAAYAWLRHQEQFAGLLRGPHAARLAVVEAGELLADPIRTLGRVSDLFGLEIDEAMASDIASGPAFAAEAKVPGKPFDPATRRMNEAAAKFAYGAEIDAALDWGHGFAGRAGIPLRLNPA